MGEGGDGRLVVDVTPADHAALVQFLVRRALVDAGERRARRNTTLKLLVCAVVAGFVISVGWRLSGGAPGSLLHWPTALVAMACFVIVGLDLWLRQRRVQRALTPAADGALCGQRVFSRSPEGIRIEAAHSDGIVRWSGVRAVDETAEHVFIRIDTCAGYVIPKRGLDAERVASFVAGLRQLTGA